MRTLTMKFGGTSVGSPQALSQAAEIVLTTAQEWDAVVVVVSAANGVTDALLKGALTAAGGDGQTYLEIEADLRGRHGEVVRELLSPGGESASLLDMVDQHLAEFTAFCRSIHVLGEVTPRAMDTIVSVGERMNAALLAALLRRRGATSEAVLATELIVTDATFQKAAPLMEPTRARVEGRLVPLLGKGIIPVVTGFIGATEQGVTTTLGRGGSD
ncbi:MAG: aspartate kinase, partial [Anaerolineae bacterium]|nr:aspartate kinase [Anaerolineae bacterium]